MSHLSVRRMLVLAVLCTTVFALAMAGPSMAATSTVTQADCDNNRITRNGSALSQSECEKLIGKRVNFAQTGMDAWIFVVLGVSLLGGAVVLQRRRRSLKAQLPA